MSSTGILLLILALFLILNADQLAWVFMGHSKLNTKGFERTPRKPSNEQVS